jgi:hypothetical protein
LAYSNSGLIIPQQNGKTARLHLFEIQNNPIMFKTIKTLLMMLLFAGVASAQSFVSGKVVDGSNGEALPGANVLISGTTQGTQTDAEGKFKLRIPQRNFTIQVSFIGYTNFSKTVKSEGNVDMGTIKLMEGSNELSAVEIVASRSTAESPFVFEELDKKEIVQNLGSRDLPNVLNVSPSVYSTNQGGGAGDSRINVRGFDQRNVAVMINGVPVNDMENGWVYWSNWDGLGDASSSIQVQRGISPVNISVPSVGGTINIITDPAGAAQSTTLRQEMGSFGFRKTTFGFNSGIINEKFAFSMNLVRKTGDGFYQGTFTDAYAYYFGASYQLSDEDKFEIYAVGAPQRHGQNLYMQNMARYSHDFARQQEDYDRAALFQYREAGRDFNQNYGGVSSNYLGRQYYEMYNTNTTQRFAQDYIMERENYYHKPQVNLNWYHTFNKDLRWSNVLYWSGGKGGGTGTYGSVSTDYSFQGMGIRQWDAEIAQNSNNIDQTYHSALNASTGIIRNSVNQQNTYGAISKLSYQANDALNLQVGVDYRWASIDHWREVRDLLGGDYYAYTGNDFDLNNQDYMKGLGDKIAYNNNNTVTWLGGYAQGVYDTDKWNIFGMAGYTVVAYDYTDYFTADADGNELNLATDNLPGYQFKGGVAYKLSREFNFFANGGYISRNPIFDYAINDGSGVVYNDPLNEKVSIFEAGASYYIGNKFGITVNYYNTTWSDRTITQTFRLPNGDEDFLFLGGLGQNHSGVEIAGSYQPLNALRFDFGSSFGNWEYTSDVNATYTTYENGSPVENTFDLYVDGLKVGDAPQTQAYVSATLDLFEGLSVKADYRYYTNFYSNFNPLDRTDEGDRTQSWEVPSYGVVDLHAYYDIPLKTSEYSISAFVHVFNALDALYIQDAIDNSAYNSFDQDHDADDAEVFFGIPRNFNAGFTIRF